MESNASASQETLVGVGMPPAPTPRSGCAAAASRQGSLTSRRVATWETVASTTRKLFMLWAALYRARRFSEEDFVHYQERRLRRTLRWAYRQIPLYRELWGRAGVGPESFAELADLRRFPILEKDDIRNRWPDGAIAQGAQLDRCRIQQTSGSSGRCMEIALSLRCDDARNIYSQRIYGWHGFRWFRRVAYVFPYRLPFENNLGLYRNVYIDGSQAAKAIVQAIGEVRPVVLAATPSDLLELLEGWDGEGDLRALGLRALCLHSEPLSQDELFHFEAVFGCPVRTNYYCNEVWAIAAECEFGSMHEFLDNVVLELLDPEGRPVPDGEAGEVVVTSLNNFVQPFIRYRLGDLAVRRVSRKCRCGRGLPVLGRLEGRDDDFFLHPDGHRIHPSKITVAVKSPCFAYPGLQIFRDYQIVQDRPDHVTIRLVPGRDREPFERCAHQGAANLRALLEPGVDVRLHVVDRVPAGAGGKRRIFGRLVGVREEGENRA